MSNINENDNLSLSSSSDKKTYDVTYSFLCQGTSSIEVTDSKLFDKNDPSYLGDDSLQEHLSNAITHKDLHTLIKDINVIAGSTLEVHDIEVKLENFEEVA